MKKRIKEIILLEITRCNTRLTYVQKSELISELIFKMLEDEKKKNIWTNCKCG